MREKDRREVERERQEKQRKREREADKQKGRERICKRERKVKELGKKGSEQCVESDIRREKGDKGGEREMNVYGFVKNNGFPVSERMRICLI